MNIHDIPAFYTAGKGPSVFWELSYDSLNSNPASDIGPFNYLFGPNFSCNFSTHVVDLGSSAHVVMSGGNTDVYNATSSGNYQAAQGGNYNILTKNTSTGQFTLALPKNGGSYTFGKVFNSGSFTYAAVTQVADIFGSALTLTYSTNAVPKLLTVVDANGNTSNVSYNSAGQVSQVADPFGATAQFGYTTVNGANLLSSLTDQAGYTSTMTYDSQGRITALTTPMTAPNPTTQFVYNGTTGQVTSSNNTNGNSRTIKVGTSTATLTDELGRQTIYDFSNNNFGGAGVITDALGNKTQQTFDGNRNLIQVINPRGYFSKYTYDANGNRLTQVDYLNLYPDPSVSIQRSWTYDNNSNMLSATDPLGTEKWSYTNNQVASHTDKLGQTATYTYNSLGKLLTVIDRNGVTIVTNAYDATTGFRTSTADALGNTVKFAYNNRGRLIQQTDAAGNVTAISRDLLDRPILFTYADKTTVQYSFSCCLHTQTTDQFGNVFKMVYDNLGRKVQVADPTGATVKFAYDAVGNATLMIDPNGHTCQWQYDAMNRRIKQIDPVNNQETASYDAAGNLVNLVDGNNATTTFAYDALNRMKQTTYPDNSIVAVTYDSVGNRLTAINTVGQWTWTYNANSWPTSLQTPMASTAAQYQYDNEGHRTQLTDPDGNAIATTYDKAYRTSSVGFAVGSQAETVLFQYDPRGLPTKRTLPNGVASSFAYDALGRMTSIQHAQSGGTILYSFAYQYDSAGNPTQETSQRWSTSQGATVAYQANYSYDSRYMLIGEKYSQAGNATLEMDYTYDAVGNRIKGVTTTPNNADSPVTVASSYTADNQLSQSVRTAPQDATQTTNFAEDGDGSLTQATAPSGTTLYTYNYARELTKVGLPGGTAVQFAYDPDGLRVQKTSTSGIVTNFVPDRFQSLLEKNNGGTTTVRYVPGMARIANGAAAYYLEDRLGSVVGLVNANQNVTDTFRFDAWGNLITQQGTTNPSYQWVGESGYYLNADAGTYSLGFRHLVPTTGKFLTRDPIGLKGKTPNLYQYALNRPLYFADPDGLTVVCAGGGGFLGVLLAGSGSVYICNDSLGGKCIPPQTSIVICAGAGLGLGASLSADCSYSPGCLSSGGSFQTNGQGGIGYIGGGVTAGGGNVSGGVGAGPGTPVGGALTGELCYTT